MCHNKTSTGGLIKMESVYESSCSTTQSQPQTEPITNQINAQEVKSNFRLNPFRRVAKTARINLNRYWKLLSKIHRHSSTKTTFEFDFAAEMEQNRINELLEAHALASSQNSINSQWEEDLYSRETLLLPYHHETVTSSPQPIRRLFRTAKRSLHSSTSSAMSSQSCSYCEEMSSSSQPNSIFL